MPKSVHIVWNDEFDEALALAIEKMTIAAALEIEGQAKINIQANKQVDTGFMVNSVYTASDKGVSNIPASGETHSKKEGRTVKRNAAPAEQPPENGTLVGVAAEYALYQEVDNAFLYPAAETVANSRGAKIVEAGKEAFDE